MVRLLRVVGLTLGLAAALAAGAAWGADAAGSAEALRTQYASLKERLTNNPYQRPMVIESVQSSGDLKGEVYAVVDQPYAPVRRELSQASQWCEVLILHLNVKHCGASGEPGAQRLAVTLGKKVEQDLEDAYRVDFHYGVASATADYLRVQLRADEGPLGTRDYRIVLEALPLDEQRSFLHLTYSYGYGVAARIAMQGYLSTIGAGKVGFTVVGKTPDGQPKYVDSVRGVVERNTMRYYLAIEAYLASLAAPEGQRADKRFNDWFDATERYALQLHELDKGAYLEMKKKELKRQREGGIAAPSKG